MLGFQLSTLNFQLPMTIGVLTIWLEIAGSNSLKDKRQSLKSLLDLLRNKFNVSAAEVGDNDTWRRAVVGVACVSNDQAHAGAVLNKVLQFVESDPRVAVAETRMEML